MKTYAAEISTGIVTEVIVGDYVWANENLSGEWVDCTDDGDITIGIGYTYDAELGEFVAPELPIEE
jgi:glycine cleavage system H lipoate-binding protein